MQFLNRLVTLAELLNQQQVDWALGGSALLYMCGADIEPRDLDLIIDRGSIDEALSVLIQLGASQMPDLHADDPAYLTERFVQLDWDGLEVDLMVNPGIENELGRYTFDSGCTPEKTSIVLRGQNIYLSSLKEWQRYYYFLKRPHRVLQIEALLSKTDQS